MDRKTLLIGGVVVVALFIMYEFYKRSTSVITTASGSRIPLNSAAGRTTVAANALGSTLAGIIDALHSGDAQNGNSVSDPIGAFVPPLAGVSSGFLYDITPGSNVAPGSDVSIDTSTGDISSLPTASEGSLYSASY